MRRRFARFVLNAVHHREQPVRALQRERFFQAEPIKHRARIDGEDLSRRAAREDAQQHGDFPAHQMRVGIAAEIELLGLIGAPIGDKPDLARASAHTGLLIALFIAQRFEAAREFDHIRNALLPVGEERKLVCKFVDGVIDAGHVLEMRLAASPGKPGLVASAVTSRRDRRDVGLRNGADAEAHVAQAVLAEAEGVLITETRR